LVTGVILATTPMGFAYIFNPFFLSSLTRPQVFTPFISHIAPLTLLFCFAILCSATPIWVSSAAIVPSSLATSSFCNIQPTAATISSTFSCGQNSIISNALRARLYNSFTSSIILLTPVVYFLIGLFRLFSILFFISFSLGVFLDLLFLQQYCVHFRTIFSFPLSFSSILQESLP